MTSDTRSPEEIEREIERERAGLTNTLDDLQNRFSVETIARQVSDQFREHGGDIGRSVSDAVKRNPVALALTGVGLAWLMLGDKTGGRDRHDRYDRDARFDQGDRYRERLPDDRYDTRDRDHDHAGRIGSSDRGVSGARSGSRLLGPQPGNPSKPYYSGRYARAEDIPSWAQNDDDDNGAGMGAKMRNAASSAGEGVSDAASSAARGVGNAGSTISEKAKGAAGAVSDAGKSAASSARGMASSASDRATALRNRLAEGTENLSEEARHRVMAARERALEARQTAMSYVNHGRDRAIDIFEEQPLIAGALAVAVGAALGAALPRSRMEDEYLGEHSDRLMDEAERIYAEEKEKLSRVAKSATAEAGKIASEAMDEAENVAKAAVDKAKVSGERIAGAAQAEASKQNLGDVKKT